MLAVASHSFTLEKGGAVISEPVPPPEDPSCPIKGMYRLLDLIMEQGNNGLGKTPCGSLSYAHGTLTVDKIVIAQESLQAFISAISPGSYSSITKVNFKKLDDLLLKPIGVYGSKEEIVRFLCEMNAVAAEMCVYPFIYREKLMLNI